MTEVLRCEACGGAVVWDAARSSAACLFCATPALRVVPESPPTPAQQLPHAVAEARAAEAFRAWAARSWFRPRELRDASVSLQPMLLPAWRIHARLETHWAGLRRARTRSRRSPVAGVEAIELTHVIPASSGISGPELVGLLPFDETQAEAWAGSAARREGLAWELPALTRRGALARARVELCARHRRRIVGERGLLSANVGALIEERDVSLVMLPIYIGSFRFRDRPWRFLINAQSGKVVGDAPVDRTKIALVVLAGLLVAGLALWLGAQP